MKIPVIVLTCLVGAATLAATALAAEYPVSGRWGPSVAGQQGAIDCAGKRVIGFNGDTRTDSNGGVPGYRNRSVTADGPQQFRVVDEFTTGQISNAHTTYTLRLTDADHIEMRMQGGTLKLQRCK
jgi:hypothetical protein